MLSVTKPNSTVDRLAPTIFFRDLVPGSTQLPNPDPFRRATVLYPGDALFSILLNFKLTLQTDGNLVLYAVDDGTLPLRLQDAQYSKAIWSSGTQGSSVASCNINDGLFKLVDQTGATVWLLPFESWLVQPKETSAAECFLRCQCDGNLVVYYPDGNVGWTSNTYAGKRS